MTIVIKAGILVKINAIGGSTNRNIIGHSVGMGRTRAGKAIEKRLMEKKKERLLSRSSR